MAIIDGIYTLHEPRAALAPAVFDSPHSGTHCPPEWGCLPSEATLCASGVDNFVDELFAEAPQFGAPLLAAHFHRAFIDANRSSTEIDLELLDGPWPDAFTDSVQARRGRGVIWRTSTPDLVLYDRKLTVAEVRHRIRNYWQPYQDALKAQLDRAHAAFGVAFHLNCHSNRQYGTAEGPDAGQLRPEMELGTREGATTSPAFTRFVKETLESLGYQVVVDGFHKGQHLIRDYGDPARGRSSIMLEIRKDLYMDQETLSRNARFEECRFRMSRLAEAICSFARSHASIKP